MINGLGERMQEQRLALRLSQKEVAANLGVSSSVISNYESGERTPSVEMLMALARLYGCSTDYLLGFSKEPTGKYIDVSMLSHEQRRLLQYLLSSIGQDSNS